MKPSNKLALSALGIVVLLFVSAPTIFSYGWQFVHGRKVTLGGLSLRLAPNWIVLHGEAVRLREDTLIHLSDETLISVTQIKKCQTEASASVALLRMQQSVTKHNSLPWTNATILMAGKRASCFIVGLGADTTETACLSPDRQNLVIVHARSKYQEEAVHMLQDATETSTCTQ